MEKKSKNKFYKKLWFWVIVIFIAIVVVGATANASNNKDKSNASAGTAVDGKNDTITYDNFMKIEMGDKFDTVVELLGEDYEERSSDAGGIITCIYSWKDKGSGKMNVVIQNYAVTMKAQLGLNEMDTKVTTDKYNQIQDGMTYDQVKAILGEGELTSQTKTADVESYIYSWINKDGSNMTCTFLSDKITKKTQSNLK